MLLANEEAGVLPLSDALDNQLINIQLVARGAARHWRGRHLFSGAFLFFFFRAFQLPDAIGIRGQEHACTLLYSECSGGRARGSETTCSSLFPLLLLASPFFLFRLTVRVHVDRSAMRMFHRHRTAQRQDALFLGGHAVGHTLMTSSFACYWRLSSC